jgi:DnaD/phage-associated family protein
MTAYTFRVHAGASGITIIPNIFIDTYMPPSDGNFVKVYLLGLLEASGGASLPGDSLSRRLGLIESDILKAWEYWESKGLVQLTRSPSNDVEVQFLPIAAAEKSGGPPRQAGTYDPEYIHDRMEDSTLKDMFEGIEKLLARMLSPREISVYLSWIDDFSFPPEVILLLIEYCKSKNKVDTRYIEKVALAWHDAQVNTIDAAHRYITHHEERYNNYRLVLDFLGLKENDLMKPQEEFLDKWFSTWGFSLEMVLEACKICSLRINEPNFSYIDGILSNWQKKGIKNLKEIETGEGKKGSKNVKFKPPVNSFNSYDQRSYDIKELERKLLGRNVEEENEQ